MSQRGRGHRQCHGLKKWAEPLAELEDTEEKIPEGTVLNSARAHQVLVSGRPGVPSRQLERHMCNTGKTEIQEVFLREQTTETMRWSREEAGERRSSRDSISGNTSTVARQGRLQPLQTHSDSPHPPLL